MSGRSFRAGQALLLSAFMLMCLTAISWACTVQPGISGDILKGSARAKVTLVGTSFPKEGEGAASTEGPVEVRWDSPEGAVLGTAEPDDNGSFSVSVTVPEADPGVHFFIATRNGEAVARSPFTLVDPPGSSESEGQARLGDLWSGFEPSHPANAQTPEDAVTGQDAPRSMAVGATLLGVGAAGMVLLALAALRRPRIA